MFLIACVLGLACMGALFPQTPVGRRLFETLVDKPARWLNAASPAKLIGLAAVVLLVVAAPELAFLMAGDLALYVEIATAAAMLGTALRLKGAARAVAALAGSVMTAPARIFRTAARQRSRPTAKPRRPSSRGDDPAGAFAFA